MGCCAGSRAAEGDLFAVTSAWWVCYCLASYIQPLRTPSVSVNTLHSHDRERMSLVFKEGKKHEMTALPFKYSGVFLRAHSVIIGVPKNKSNWGERERVKDVPPCRETRTQTVNSGKEGWRLKDNFIFAR